MPRIHYCTVVYERWETFRLLMATFVQMAAQPGNETDSLCVYSWGGKDINAAWPDNVKFCPGPERGHINRAAGRNKAMQCADAESADLVFFVDCDMVLPLDFSARVRANVRPGHVYFPICYSLYKGAPMVVTTDGAPYRRVPGTKANGWWRESGRGNCGFVVEDFHSIGGWDGERWSTRYGREDDDIYKRANAQYEIHRERVPGFFHQWHTKLPEEQNPSTRKEK